MYIIINNILKEKITLFCIFFFQNLKFMSPIIIKFKLLLTKFMKDTYFNKVIDIQCRYDA